MTSSIEICSVLPVNFWFPSFEWSENPRGDSHSCQSEILEVGRLTGLEDQVQRISSKMEK